jgi:hypothetical protein
VFASLNLLGMITGRRSALWSGDPLDITVFMDEFSVLICPDVRIKVRGFVAD